MAQLKNTTISDTGFLQLPVGTTGQRPTPVAGQMRFNSTLGRAEFYNDDQAAWKPTINQGVIATGGTVYDVDTEGTTYRVHVFTSTGNSTFTVSQGGEVEYLIVAGGGGGGGTRHAGGGGAGGVLTGVATVTSQSHTVTVGTGGAGGPLGGARGTSGLNSSAFGFTAIGGGGGASSSNGQGLSGGSGGGASRFNGSAAGTAGQGNAGGIGDSVLNGQGAGGGGGGGAGGPALTNFPGGSGGTGLSSSITGTNQFYAGGGGAGGAPYRTNGTPGIGGLGGGGDGTNFSTPGFSGTPNTGGGGGGCGGSITAPDTAGAPGGAGASGIVIIRYPLRQENPVTAAGKTIGDALVLDLDFAKPTVYAGAGTTVSDSRLNGITGTLVNGPVFTDPRTHRSNFRLLPDPAQIITHSPNEIPQINSITNSSPFTFSIWFKINSFPPVQTGATTGLLQKGSYNPSYGCNIYYTGDSGGVRTTARAYCGIRNLSGAAGSPGRGFISVNSVTLLLINQWYRLDMTHSFSGTTHTINIYINGILDATVNNTAATHPVNFQNDLNLSTNDNILGGNFVRSDLSVGGHSVYLKALTATEVAQQYNATRWRFGV